MCLGKYTTSAKFLWEDSRQDTSGAIAGPVCECVRCDGGCVCLRAGVGGVPGVDRVAAGGETNDVNRTCGAGG